MAIVGLDGNDAPLTIEEAPARLWMAIQARAYTYRGREPNRPNFGLGLVDGLINVELPQEVWDRRVRESFADLEDWDAYDFEIRVAGGSVSLVVNIREA